MFKSLPENCLCKATSTGERHCSSNSLALEYYIVHLNPARTVWPIEPNLLLALYSRLISTSRVHFLVRTSGLNFLGHFRQVWSFDSVAIPYLHNILVQIFSKFIKFYYCDFSFESDSVAEALICRFIFSMESNFSFN